ncbi:non-specific lipid-transfer protein 2-like [Rhodamnia argentea]|uniref:Non-specific lipid-transfer protein 2-like n=1 Tax=Rhodamnia argentea TaxID=178133 RepID=A0ABM3GYF4_9MYRT|nr:non-specific lipid-transfer protein 2-like [Rhodamnia argentea]
MATQHRTYSPSLPHTYLSTLLSLVSPMKTMTKPSAIRSPSPRLLAAALVATALVFLAPDRAPVAEAVTCSPTELSSCMSAITSSAPPSALCCSKLRQQRPCLCGYIRNPNLRQYVTSPNAMRVASTCGVPTPTC